MESFSHLYSMWFAHKTSSLLLDFLWVCDDTNKILIVLKQAEQFWAAGAGAHQEPSEGGGSAPQEERGELQSCTGRQWVDSPNMFLRRPSKVGI